MALAHFFAGHIDSAVTWAEKAAGNLPSLLVAAALMAASHALAGRTGEAQEAMERLHTLDPSMRITKLKDWLPIHRPDDMARFAEGLWLAGLPE